MTVRTLYFGMNFLFFLLKVLPYTLFHRVFDFLLIRLYFCIVSIIQFVGSIALLVGVGDDFKIFQFLFNFHILLHFLGVVGFVFLSNVRVGNGPTLQIFAVHVVIGSHFLAAFGFEFGPEATLASQKPALDENGVIVVKLLLEGANFALAPKCKPLIVLHVTPDQLVQGLFSYYLGFSFEV